MKYIATTINQIEVEAESIIQAKEKVLCRNGVINNTYIIGPILPEELIYSMEKGDKDENDDN